MWRIVTAAAPAAMLFLVGCNQYGYRYQPHAQMTLSPIHADYRIEPKSVDILVDTNGMKLNNIAIAKSDGELVQPTSVDTPTFKPQYDTGNEVTMASPAEFAQGPTVAHFDKNAIGPGPWDVHVDINSMSSKTIRVGGPEVN
jgi:hypothetical protein